MKSKKETKLGLGRLTLRLVTVACLLVFLALVFGPVPT